MKRFGLFVAAGVVAVLAVVFLLSRELSAFGGAVITAAVLAILAVKQRPAAPHSPSVRPAVPAAPAPQRSVPSSPVPQGPVFAATPAIPPVCAGQPSFGSWDMSIHGADGQDVRMDRALFQNISIYSYDPVSGVAVISGTRGDQYKTTLDTCTCEDFQRRGLPCKHIYKLALASGYTADAFFSARSDLVWYADGCQVYHSSPDCRGLRKRYSRRTTVALAEYKGLRPCKSCHDH